MPELELFEYYKKMCERNIVLDFQGAISQEMLVGMAELIKGKFSWDLGHTSVVKRIFSIFVEMAQNIAFYSAERVRINHQMGDVGAGIIIVTEKDKCYTITSGNMVNAANIDGIIKHCNKINILDKEELKKFYKEKIKASRKEGEKGAGVGLIDVARKSGNVIRYEVTTIDEHYSFLVLSVKVQEEKNK